MAVKAMFARSAAGEVPFAEVSRGVVSLPQDFGDGELDSFRDSLSDAERRAYTSRVVGLNNARAGSVAGGENSEDLSVIGTFFDHFWDGPSALATGVGNSLGTTVDAVLDPIGTLRNFKDTGGLILHNLFTRNPLDNIRDVAQGVGGYVQEQWDKGLVGLGELIGDAAQGYGGAKLLGKFGGARNGARVVDDVPKKRVKFPGNDATTAPDGFEWRGKPGSATGSKEGNYYNPKTGESLRPDLNHPGPIGPHWDHRDSFGKWWRIFPDGSVEPK